jgi:hypothetical protein
MSDAVDKVKEGADEVAQKAKQATEKVREKTKVIADEVTEQSSGAKDRAKDSIREGWTGPRRRSIQSRTKRRKWRPGPAPSPTKRRTVRKKVTGSSQSEPRKGFDMPVPLCERIPVPPSHWRLASVSASA